MHYYIYQITNHLNGKIYIGVHKTSDMDDGYMGSGKLIKCAIDKHGINNFTKDILEIFETAEAMYAKEKEIVTDDFLARSDVYNLRRGGTGGFDHINSIPRSQEFKDHLSSVMRGRTISEKHRRKLINSSARRGEIGTFTGKTHTAESRNKISNRYYATGKDHAEARPLIVNDVFYGSMADAERILGISANTLRDRAVGRSTFSRKYPWILSVRYGDQLTP